VQCKRGALNKTVELEAKWGAFWHLEAFWPIFGTFRQLFRSTKLCRTGFRFKINAHLHPNKRNTQHARGALHETVDLEAKRRGFAAFSALFGPFGPDLKLFRAKKLF
jgi:hypothetical protein